jgi:hypothetical protein
MKKADRSNDLKIAEIPIAIGFAPGGFCPAYQKGAEYHRPLFVHDRRRAILADNVRRQLAFGKACPYFPDSLYWKLVNEEWINNARGEK